MVVDQTGVLERLSAEGHTGIAAKGDDPVCAAASILLLTAARTLEAAHGIKIDGATERPGSLRLSVLGVAAGAREYGRGVTEMLVSGIRDLSREFPNHLELRITTKTEETTENGT